MSTTPPPPPPPEDPFPSFPGGNTNDPFQENNGEETLDQGRPSVAATPGRALLVLGIIGALLLFLLYNIFSGDDEEEEVKRPESTIAAGTIAPPPPPPVLEQPITDPPPLVPPPIPEAPRVSMLEPEDDGAEKERLLARMRSGMIISDSDSGLAGALGSGDEPASETDPNAQFGARVANTKAQRVTATHIGNLYRTIAQGRLIHATTESAINTDLPSPIRAIVSRDVFGEAGNTPLIPKGSRLIGQYNTDVLGGQTRVYVMWTRVIRPDGVDVMIGSPLVDQLGMGGIGGQVDSKFQEIFSRAVMSSLVTIGIAIGSDEITGGGDVSTTNSAFGGTTQGGEGASIATVNALNRLGSTTDTFMQKYLNLSPTITVDQGTPVNVFVNRDLVFPAEYTGARIIQ